MANQKHVAFLPACGDTSVFITLKTAGGAKRVRTDCPGKARHQQSCQSIADAASAGIEESLPAGVAMIANPQTTAGICPGAVIHITEPGAHFPRQTGEPLI